MSCLPFNEEEARRCNEEVLQTGYRSNNSTVISDALSAGVYTTRIDVARDDNVYTMFVKQIPWRPGCSELFSTCRENAQCRSLPSTHPASDGNDTARSTCLEKATIRLFSAEQLHGMLQGRDNHHRLRGSFSYRLRAALGVMPERVGDEDCGQGKDALRIIFSTYENITVG